MVVLLGRSGWLVRWNVRMMGWLVRWDVGMMGTDVGVAWLCKGGWVWAGGCAMGVQLVGAGKGGIGESGKARGGKVG